MIPKVCFFLLMTSLFFEANPCEAQSLKTIDLSGSAGVAGNVFDQKTGKPLPARIEIYDSGNILQATYYEHLPGIFTEEDGSFKVQLHPGKYKLKAFHGFDYLSQEIPLEIKNGEVTQITIKLRPWLPLRELGWINGEAHAHLYTEKKPDRVMLAGVKKICRAQGVDFICAAQGWAGAGDESWRKDYAAVSDSNFLMYYGAEMPKYRTGHYWWIGLESTKGFFGKLIDSAYETRYYQSPDRSHWTFDSINFSSYPDVELVPRLADAQSAVPVMAHPTRWWMQERERSTKYTTNAIASLTFSLLAGTPAGGLVVMGDVKDHYSYQNLWFHILNLGYRMPAFSELDGGYLPGFKYPFGLMRTYFQVKQEGNHMESIVEAAQNGNTFVSSGPVILAQIDGKYGYGDIIEPDGKAHTLHLEAFASGDSADMLSYLLIFRNGKIWKQWDLRKDSLRAFKKDIAIREQDRAWYVLKTYGKKAWKDSGNLEIMGWYDKPHQPESSERDICITSPFYFIRKGEEKPGPLVSAINLRLTGAHANSSGGIEILLHGKKIGTAEIRKGRAEFSMPVNAIIRVSAPGTGIVYRSLFTDYPPQLKLIEPLANGDWQKDPAFQGKIFPGYIPWEVFRFKEMKQMLTNVKWDISLVPNERDKHWTEFEQLFQP